MSKITKLYSQKSSNVGILMNSADILDLLIKIFEVKCRIEHNYLVYSLKMYKKKQRRILDLKLCGM